MRRRLTIVIVVLAVLVAAGCRSTRQAATVSPVEEPSKPAEMHREYTVISFTATMSGISANGQVRMAQDSAIWVSVNKLIELGRALATRDSVWVSAPMMDIHFAGTYDDLSKKAGRAITFDELQQIATAPDADQRIAQLARNMGYDASVAIRQRQRVDRLSFPFQKQ